MIWGIRQREAKQMAQILGIPLFEFESYYKLQLVLYVPDGNYCRVFPRRNTFHKNMFNIYWIRILFIISS